MAHADGQTSCNIGVSAAQSLWSLDMVPPTVSACQSLMAHLVSFVRQTDLERVKNFLTSKCDGGYSCIQNLNFQEPSILKLQVPLKYNT